MESWPRRGPVDLLPHQAADVILQGDQVSDDALLVVVAGRARHLDPDVFEIAMYRTHRAVAKTIDDEITYRSSLFAVGLHAYLPGG